MNLLLQWCDISWWAILLSWLVPFLFGWLIARWTGVLDPAGQSKVGPLTVSNAKDNNPSVQDNAAEKKPRPASEWNTLIRQKMEMENELAECSRKSLVWQRKIAEMEIKMSSATALTQISQPAVTKAVQAEKLTKDAVAQIGESAPNASDIDTSSVFDKLPGDKLQIFEGLGPKMEQFLNQLNVYTWDQLARQDAVFLKKKLEALDPKYRILETESWPKQAALARDRQWQKLIEYQKELSAAKSLEGTLISDSKLEKVMYKLGLLRKYDKDDLVAIEGIGPKIASILKSEGINTWSILANTPVLRLQSIIEKAGGRYQLADPSTWPQQAAMARDGLWKELYSYQDTLKGGKEIKS